jgi:hypothetical protein
MKSIRIIIDLFFYGYSMDTYPTRIRYGYVSDMGYVPILEYRGNRALRLMTLRSGEPPSLYTP